MIGDVSPIRHRAAADEVVDVLSDALRSGVYEVGGRLPSENELASKLGVSRPVLREALLVLRRAGVVTVRRGATGGTFVASLSNIRQVLAAAARHLDDETPQLLQARRALEPQVTLLTAKHATVAQLAELERLAYSLEPLLELPDDFYEVDIRFHLALGDMSSNPVLAGFQRSTLNRLSILSSEYLVREANARESFERQKDLCAAIASRRVVRVLEALDEHLAPLEERFTGAKLEYPWAGTEPA